MNRQMSDLKSPSGLNRSASIFTELTFKKPQMKRNFTISALASIAEKPPSHQQGPFVKAARLRSL